MNHSVYSNSSVDSVADSDVTYSTPKERISEISVEEVTRAFSKLRTVTTPKSRFTSAPGSHYRALGKTKGKVLFPKPEKTNLSSKWSDKEEYALVLFLMCHTDGKTWIAHKDHKFWEDAAKFVKHHSCSVQCRTGL